MRDDASCSRERPAEERRQQPLQISNERIRLICPLLHLRNLAIFDLHLLAQKFVLPLKQLDDAAVCRDMPRQLDLCRRLSRPVVGCRRLLSRLLVLILSGGLCRDRSRLVARR